MSVRGSNKTELCGKGWVVGEAQAARRVGLPGWLSSEDYCFILKLFVQRAEFDAFLIAMPRGFLGCFNYANDL